MSCQQAAVAARKLYHVRGKLQVSAAAGNHAAKVDAEKIGLHHEAPGPCRTEDAGEFCAPVARVHADDE